MELLIIAVLMVIVAIIYKRFSHVIYLLIIIDFFLKIINFVANNIHVAVFKDFVTKYFPSGIEAIISKYTSGLLETILLWVLMVIYAIFLYFLFAKFLKKR